MKRVVVGLMSAVVLVAFAGAASAQDAKVAKGKQLFTDQKCTMCHAIEGKGNVKGPLDGVGTKLTADEIRQWITDPATMATKAKADRKPAMSTMAAKYKALSKDDVDALVAYLSSLKKK
jgi:mono/diheme cytochrome c family protein